MGIEANIDWSEVNRYLEERKKTLDRLIVRNLNYLGMRCVITARTLNTYQDQTANLRNSIGYMIVKHGQISDTFFENGGRGPEYDSTETPGEVTGKQLAKEIAKNFSEGYALIVVAGMDYASYVEDVHGLDVLRPAETMAETEINGIVDSIIKSMSRNR